MKHLAEKYAAKVDFVFVYCREGHPSMTVPVDTMEKRTNQARQYAREAKGSRRVLVDEFEDRSVQALYRADSDSVFIMDKQGKLLRKLALCNASEIDAFVRDCLAEKSTTEIERPFYEKHTPATHP